MYIYLDYLDYREALGHRNFSASYKLRRLSYDLFAFPDARFAFAYPALAKCVDTAIIIGEARRLWQTGRLWPTLSPAYDGDFGAYTAAREQTLRDAFGDAASGTVELAGYLLPHWSVLLKIIESYDVPVLVRGRTGSADAAFRDEVFRAVESETLQRDLFGSAVIATSEIEAETQRLRDAAADPTDLFQRTRIMSDFARAGFTKESLRWVCHHLDMAFAAANAQAAGASLSDQQVRRRTVVRQLLDGMSVDGVPVIEALVYLPVDTIVDLSVGTAWRRVHRFVERFESEVLDVAGRDRVRLAARQTTERAAAAAIAALMIPIGVMLPGLAGVLTIGSAAWWARVPSKLAESLRRLQSEAAPHLEAFVNEVRLERSLNRGHLLAMRAAERWRPHGIRVVQDHEILNPLHTTYNAGTL